MEEEIPELHYCLPEEAETEKGVFSWVAASTNSTVKVLCPHGVVEGAPINKVWIVFIFVQTQGKFFGECPR